MSGHKLMVMTISWMPSLPKSSTSNCTRYHIIAQNTNNTLVPTSYDGICPYPYLHQQRNLRIRSMIRCDVSSNLEHHNSSPGYPTHTSVSGIISMKYERTRICLKTRSTRPRSRTTPHFILRFLLPATGRLPTTDLCVVVLCRGFVCACDIVT